MFEKLMKLFVHKETNKHGQTTFEAVGTQTEERYFISSEVATSTSEFDGERKANCRFCGRQYNSPEEVKIVKFLNMLFEN